MFRCVFISFARSKQLSLFSFSLLFPATPTRRYVFSFLLIMPMSGCNFISKLQRILCISFSRTGSSLCINLLVVWKISISCTIPGESTFSPSHIYSYILFALLRSIQESDLWLRLFISLFIYLFSLMITKRNWQSSSIVYFESALS